ncbi:hypothetical protein N8603_03145 [Verrucomicrobiales bacterium]|nr:hypothetical protein [Verrucomicrobiales bacterium]
MKLAIITLITIALISAASAKPKHPPLGDFKTVSGKVYKNAKISKVAGDYISISHQEGLSRIYFKDIPKELSTKLGLSRATARAAEKEREEAKIKLKRRQVEKSKDGPFGLWGGMTFKEAETIGVDRETNSYRKFNKNYNSASIYTHYALFGQGTLTTRKGTFLRLDALFDDKMGLVGIKTNGSLEKVQSKNKYSELVQSLTKKYGETLVTKKEKLEVISDLNDDRIVTLWQSKKRINSIHDLSIIWQEGVFADSISIEYWFVPKKIILERIATEKANQKAADKLKGKDNLNDL